MNNLTYNGLKTTIVIFGASGDLTQRKLIPSLFNLFRKRRTPKKFLIVGFGGTAFTDEQFREHLYKGMKEFAGFEFTEEEWGIFANNLYYLSGKYKETADFTRLSNRLDELEAEMPIACFTWRFPRRCFLTLFEI